MTNLLNNLYPIQQTKRELLEITVIRLEKRVETLEKLVLAATGDGK
jgi:hypothetical protein